MISANMDRGSTDFQLEAAISKVFASVGQLIWNLSLHSYFYLITLFSFRKLRGTFVTNLSKF